MKQDDPKLIEAIKKYVLKPPTFQPLNVTGKPTNYPGQFEQVLRVLSIFDLDNPRVNSNKPGFYIEAGASEGEYISNTLYFEMLYGWGGLLVEPNPYLLEGLYSKNRNAWILPHCLSIKPEVHTAQFDSAQYTG